jgi:hypothetical protein
MNDKGGKREHQGRETSRVRRELNGDDLGLARSLRDEREAYRPYRVEEGYQR